MLSLFYFFVFFPHEMNVVQANSAMSISIDTSRNFERELNVYVDSLHEIEIQLQFKENVLSEQLTSASDDKELQSKIKSLINTNKGEQTEIYLRKLDAYELLEKFHTLYRTKNRISADQETLYADYLVGLKNKNYSVDKRKSDIRDFYPQKGKSSSNTYLIPTPCMIQENTSNKILSTAYQTIIEYTNPKLESYFRENHFLIAETRLLKSNKNYYLDMKLTFHSPRAAQIYGSVESGSPIKLSFINGVYIYLKSYNTISGVLEPRTGNTIYQFQFPLDKEKIKYLSKYELDKFSFLWSSGVEEYPIYQIDVLKNLVQCLKQKN